MAVWLLPRYSDGKIEPRSPHTVLSLCNILHVSLSCRSFQEIFRNWREEVWSNNFAGANIPTSCRWNNDLFGTRYPKHYFPAQSLADCWAVLQIQPMYLYRQIPFPVCSGRDSVHHKEEYDQKTVILIVGKCENCFSSTLRFCVSISHLHWYTRPQTRLSLDDLKNVPEQLSMILWEAFRSLHHPKFFGISPFGISISSFPYHHPCTLLFVNEW